MGMMVTAGIAGASDAVPALPGSGPEASAAGGPPRAVSLGGHHHVMAHHVVTLGGRVTPGGSRLVVVRIAGRKLRAHTRSDGAYEVRWRAPHSGVYSARARVDGSTVRSRRVRVNAYRPAEASYYGPGLYGGALACGGAPSPPKPGVAHKTPPRRAPGTPRHPGPPGTPPGSAPG